MNSNQLNEAALLAEIERLKSQLAKLEQSQSANVARLYQTEERLAVAMRGASDGLWEWDLASNEVYYSPRWKAMLGYEEHELESHFGTWESLVHKGDHAYVLSCVQSYLEGSATSFEVEMRMQHKQGHYVYVRSRAFKVAPSPHAAPSRLIGTHVNISDQKKSELFEEQSNNILEMIAKGKPASDIYIEIGLLYEERHPGLRCSMLELSGNRLLHGGAPSLPKAYCEAVHGLENGPDVGSCGTSTYTGKRVLVENIETDPKWAKLKEIAMPFGMRCCWSEPIRSSAGEVIGAFGMYYDHPALPTSDELIDLIAAARITSIVMEREKNLRRITDLAYTDPLTRLSSRAHFYSTVETLIALNSGHLQFSLLYIDLDNFKGVNDSLGHDVGDLLLQEVAARLKRAHREEDYIARLSGDEFCILVTDSLDNRNASYVASRCIQMVAESMELMGRKYTPSCSIGVAHYPDNGQNLQTLLKAADTALYAAKASGKNCFVLYEPEMTASAEYRFKVEQCLREAVELQQLNLVYQPKVDLTTGAVAGFEALCRWSHSQLGPISPIEFIPIAEQIGVIKPLTAWVLTCACRQAAHWNQISDADISLAVNISPSHFLDSDLVGLVSGVLQETGLPPYLLELEVTEALVQTDQLNLVTFGSLKAMGVKVAIDDFGTGYSSFASLSHLHVDSLKIDKYFVDDMLNDTKVKKLVGSMIEMGHSLDCKVIAEGIELRDQLEILQTFGCDGAQGYLFSRPVEEDQVPDLLQKATLFT
ncbi:bifunctional diguanylate cyclase/phosphodiesterase [Shewanella gelidii]|uniref:Bifunctional diguanylate cyclase/phosphodiesterase n=1 Tax=Shewanella gelidii TaxID=1642821 RepID=A0A917JLC8_9GAMM|nr:EAL domain-containing protein [Shewanella gelidii]MCL1096893.1 EAL domain-containing protein [Shewanella gelidii]GGI70967.1 bifunctional diguanylate cyclase/phosphodiesterase [Shewanella gelidii]